VKGSTLNHFFFLFTGQLSETPVATAQQAEGAGVACLAWCAEGHEIFAGSEDGVCKRWVVSDLAANLGMKPTKPTAVGFRLEVRVILLLVTYR